MTYKQKRLITHKELEKAVMVAGSDEISIYGIVAMVAYTRGKSPYATGLGHVGYTPLGTYVTGKFPDGKDKLDNKRAIAYEVNFGQWLESKLTKLGTSPTFTGYSNNIELEINRAWKGFSYAGNNPPLTVGERKEILQAFYDTINKNGTLELVNLDKKEQLNKLRGEQTFSKVKGTLGANIRKSIEEIHEDARYRYELQLHDWVRKYKVNTGMSGDAKTIIDNVFKLHDKEAKEIAKEYSLNDNSYNGERYYVALRLTGNGVSGDTEEFEEISEIIFDEETFSIGEVAQVFKLDTGWEEEMIEEFNKYFNKYGFDLGLVW